MNSGIDPLTRACLDESTWPSFVNRWPSAQMDIEGLSGRILKGDHGWIIFMAAAQDVHVPAHRHGAQWGITLDGRMELIIGDQARVFEHGETHFIPAGVEHAAVLYGGWRGLYLFERPVATS